jgi:hypothetical protein
MGSFPAVATQTFQQDHPENWIPSLKQFTKAENTAKDTPFLNV